MPIEVRPIVSRAEWLTWRRKDITASEVSALFDEHPYVTAFQLYQEKRGNERPPEDNKAMRRGRWLQPAAAEAVRELRPDWKILPADSYFRDPELRLGATPDYWIEGDPRGRGVLETKTVAPSVWHHDWHDGSNPPLWVRLQCLTQMMQTSAAFGAIAVLLVDPHAMECEIIEIARHPKNEATIVAAVRQFWADVEVGREPDPNFTKDAELIKALSPIAEPGKTIDLSGHNSLPMLLEKHAQLRKQIRHAKDMCEAAEAEIKWVMGDAESVTGIDGWHITYKNQPKKGYFVDPSNPRVLHIRDRRSNREKEPI